MDENLVLRILAISYFYPPSETPRAIQVSRYVKYSQHSFTIITNSLLNKYKKDDIASRCKRKIISVNDIKINNMILQKILSHLIIPDDKLFWSFQVIKKVLKQKNFLTFDCIITFCQPFSTALAGLILKLLTKKPWILHLSDPWAYNEYIKFWRIKFIINKIFEYMAFTFCDKIIFTSEQCRKFYKRKYKDLKQKFIQIPHSFKKNKKLVRALNHPKKQIIIRHLGSFYGKRSPEIFFKEILNKTSEQQKDFILEFYGKKLFIDSKTKTHLRWIKFFDKISYIKSLEKMRSADGLVCIDGQVKFPIYLPSKLIEYVGSCKPIFALSDSQEIKKIIKKTNGNFVSFKKILNAKKEFLKFIKKCRKYKNISKEKYIQKFDAEINANIFDNIIKKVSSY